MSYSIFAIEIAARTWINDPFRQALHGLIVGHPAASSPIQKRQLYVQIAQHIQQNFQSIEKGCWDYFDNHEKAVADFDMWVRGMLTEEGARQQPSYEPDPRYLTFTMAFLLVQGTPADQAIAQRCNVPQENLWRRDVFNYIVQAVPAIDFANVQADVLYMLPRDDEFALTPQDLTQPNFHYLRQLV